MLRSSMKKAQLQIMGSSSSEMILIYEIDSGDGKEGVDEEGARDVMGEEKSSC